MKPRQTITRDLLYQRQRPENATKHESIIHQHDNARLHVTKSVKDYLQNKSWEISLYPPSGLDFIFTEYHLFQSIQNQLSGEGFTSVKDIRKLPYSFWASKNEEFFQHAIHILTEKCKKTDGGQYFK